MGPLRVAVIAGDGIGPEVIGPALRAASLALAREGAQAEWNQLPWGSHHSKQYGQIMPAGGWDLLRQHDAILMGALGSPDVPETVTVNGLLLPLRRKFDLYVNLRPAYLFEGVESPLRGKAPGAIDL